MSNGANHSDTSGDNFVIPIENVKCLLLTADYVHEEETLILSVPLVEEIVTTCLHSFL